jgi:outer membrane protein assembly factor BamA
MEPMTSRRPKSGTLFCLAAVILIVGGSCLAADAGNDGAGVRIDSIHIENTNIFDLDSAQYDYWIFAVINKLHIKTRKYVIARELLQKKGDLFSRELADETERNLRTLSFLWNARVDLVRSPDGSDVMEVVTSDTWTLLGGLSISRIAGRTQYHMRLEELNLLGAGQFVSFHYYFREVDDDYVQLTFLERRLFNSHLFLELFYDSSPEVGVRGLATGKLFHSLESKVSYRGTLTELDRRNDYYSEGEIVADEKMRGTLMNVRGAYRFGTYLNKVTLGCELVHRDIKVTDERLFDPRYHVRFSEDSLYYVIAPEFAIQSFDYIKTTRLSSFRRIEDIGFEKGAAVRFGWARDGRKNGTLFNNIQVTLNHAGHWGSNLLFLKLQRMYWFKESRNFRKTAQFSIRYYNNGTSWVTPVINAVYSEDLRPNTVATLYLGENNGLRGYPKNFSTGERRFVANIENRIFPGIGFFSADLGAVQFVDFGRSWARGTGLKVGDILWSVGVGLRIGVEKFSNARTTRIDLAYAGKIKEWRLSFALGQYVDL